MLEKPDAAIKSEQSRETGNIGYTRHKTKTNKIKKTAQYYDAFSEYDLTGKVKKMEEIVYKALLNSFHKRLAYLAGKKKTGS
jgi:hypothetical protein